MPVSPPLCVLARLWRLGWWIVALLAVGWLVMERVG